MQIFKKKLKKDIKANKNQWKYHDNILMSKMNTIRGKKRAQSRVMSQQLLEPHQICFL